MYSTVLEETHIWVVRQKRLRLPPLQLDVIDDWRPFVQWRPLFKWHQAQRESLTNRWVKEVELLLFIVLLRGSLCLPDAVHRSQWNFRVSSEIVLQAICLKMWVPRCHYTEGYAQTRWLATFLGVFMPIKYATRTAAPPFYKSSSLVVYCSCDLQVVVIDDVCDLFQAYRKLIKARSCTS